MSAGAIEAGRAFVRIEFKNDTSRGAKQVNNDLKSVADGLRGLRNTTQRDARGINGDLKSIAEGLRGIALIGIGSKMLTSLRSALELLSKPVQVAASIEAATKSMEALTGSALSANRIVGDLRSFAAKTSLRFEGLASTVNLLLGYGDSVRSVVQNSKLLGEVAQGDQDKLGRMALAFGQIRAQGRLLGTELRQLTESGFNPLEEIGRKTGVPLRTLIKEMSAGNITFEQVRAAFVSATSAGGRFYKFLETRAGTLVGLWDNFKDNLEIAIEPIGNALLPALKQVLGAGIELAQVFAQFARQNQGLVKVLAFTTAGLGLASIALVAVGGSMAVASGAYLVISRALTGIGTALGLVNRQASAQKVAITIEEITDEATLMSAGVSIAAQQVGLALRDMRREFRAARRESVGAFQGIAGASLAMAKVIDAATTKSILKIQKLAASVTAAAAIAAAAAASIGGAAAAAKGSSAGGGTGGGGGGGKGRGGRAGAASAATATATASTAKAFTTLSTAAGGTLIVQSGLVKSTLANARGYRLLSGAIRAATKDIVLFKIAATASFAGAVKPVALLGGTVAHVADDIVEDAEAVFKSVVSVAPAGLLGGSVNKVKEEIVEDADVLMKAAGKPAGAFSRMSSLIGKSFASVGAAIGPLLLRLGSLGTVATSVGAAISGAFGGGVIGTIAAVAIPVLALAGGLTYLLHRAELLQPLVNSISSTFNRFKDVISETFGGISDALAAGEYVLAAKILWSGIKLAFYTGVEKAISAIPAIFENGFSVAYKLVEALVGTIIDLFASIPSLISAAATGGASIQQIITDIFVGNFSSGEINRLVSKETDTLFNLTAEAAKAKGAVDKANSDSQKALEATEAKQNAIREANDKLTLAMAAAESESVRQTENVKAGVAEIAKSLSNEAIKEANKGAAERAEKLREEITELSVGARVADQYRLATSGVVESRRREILILESQKKWLESVTETQKKLTELRIDIVAITQGEAAANRLKLAQEGLNRSQIGAVMNLENQKKYLEEATALRQEIFGLRSSLNNDPNASRRVDLAREGLNDEQIQEIMNLEKRRDRLKALNDEQTRLKDEAKTLKESLRSPLEVFQAKVRDIQQMVAMGELTPVQAQKAIEMQRKDLGKGGSVTGITTGITGRGAGMLNAIRGQYAGAPGDKQLITLSKQQLAVARRQEEIQERIAAREENKIIQRM